MTELPDAALQPPTYKNRRVGLVIFGVVEILIGLVLGLMIPFTIFLAFAPTPPNQPHVPSWAIWFGGLFYLILSSFFITVGLGSIRAKRWARIAMLVISWIWLAFGLVSLLTLAVVVPAMLHSTAEHSSTDPHFFRTVMIVMGLFMCLIYVGFPTIFLLFYSNKHVKATCEAASAPVSRPTSPRPLAVSIVSWFFFLSLTVSMPIALVMQAPAAFFGTFLTGWAARLYFFLSIGLLLYFAWEFYNLRLRGWWGIVALQALWPVSAAITIWKVGSDEFWRMAGRATPEQMQNPMTGAMFHGPFLWLMLVVWPVLFLGFLMYLRKHFTSEGLTNTPV